MDLDKDNDPNFSTENRLANSSLVWHSISNLVHQFGRLIKSEPAASLLNKSGNFSWLDTNANNNPLQQHESEKNGGWNDVIMELKRKQPDDAVRFKCEYYGEAKSPEMDFDDLSPIFQNTSTGESSSSAASITTSDYRCRAVLEQENANLKTQIADLKKEIASLKSTVPGTKPNHTRPTPPTPPPKPMFLCTAPTQDTVVVPRNAERKSSDSNSHSERERDEYRDIRSGVIRSILEGGVSLKSVRQSTPKANVQDVVSNNNSVAASSYDLIAEGLRKKFANVERDSQLTDYNNSFTQNFDSDDFDDTNNDSFASTPISQFIADPPNPQIISLS